MWKKFQQSSVYDLTGNMVKVLASSGKAFDKASVTKTASLKSYEDWRSNSER